MSVILAQRDGVRVLGIRKCGHTSIINTFMTESNPEQRLADDQPLVHNSTARARALNAYQGDETNCQDWPRPNIEVAFIRDPARRALSAYHHFFIRDHRDFRYTFKQNGFRKDMTFEVFVNRLHEVDLAFDPHVTPFSHSLTVAAVEDVPYAICPLEMIDDCWAPLMTELNINCPQTVQQHNVGGYNPDDFLTPELETRLRRLYSEDYRLWEYIYHEARAAFSPVSNPLS